MLKTNQPKINLGKLKYGQPYTFHYNIENPSSSTIKVDKLVMGCSSCTKAHMETDTLLPGQSTRVVATFTPGSTGIQSKHIDIIYNNKLSTLSLKFTATVEK